VIEWEYEMITLINSIRTDPQIIQTVLKFRKGEIIFHQGDPTSHWFDVISGTVRTCHFYEDGHRHLTGFFYPGDAFGVAGNVHQATAEAVTNATLRCHANGAAPEADAPPSIRALERALNSAQACIDLLGHRTAADRMAAFLLATARRIGVTGPFLLPMSRADIADHLGLTIHTVSRILSDFVRRRLIALDGPQAITICDKAGLARVAGGGAERPVWTEHRSAQPSFANS
jgi:CRP/FNR family transcriptional regulator, nitrogen fixation regulation protein